MSIDSAEITAANQGNQPNIDLERIQKLTRYSFGLLSPSSYMDAEALVLNYFAAPHVDEWDGIIGTGLSYGNDIYDGLNARATETTSFGGKIIDAFGDKAKVLYDLWHIWKMRRASRVVIAAVGLQNAANMGITVLDRALNTGPHIDVSSEGKIGMFSQVTGVGIDVIGTKVAETKPALGRTIKVAGMAIATAGLVTKGLPATANYWRRFKEGEKRPWVKKLNELPSKLSESRPWILSNYNE